MCSFSNIIAPNLEEYTCNQVVEVEALISSRKNNVTAPRGQEVETFFKGKFMKASYFY